MSVISHINNGESGLSARTKLNLVIDRTTIFDTAANFTSNNPTLNVGQIGVETDDLLTVPQFKIGDGANDWNTLPYFNSGGSQSLQDVVTVSPTVDGYLAKSLDNLTTYYLENNYAAIDSNDGVNYSQVVVSSGNIVNQVNSTSVSINDSSIDLTTTSLTKNSVEIATVNDIPSTTGLVPYTGANQDVDLGNNGLNAKTLNIKGTGGAGHLGLKHQSASITANTSESSLGADSSGNPVWKNDGNAIQNVMLENSSITGATKTKITYDSKGLVTSGTDATTADISDSTNKRYVTDAQLTVIGNTSGTNTGDETTSSIQSKLGTASTSTGGYLTSTDWNTFNNKQSSLNFYNVKDYGAIGNGSTDDSSAIQSAITASIAATGHVKLLFPNGTYKVNTALSIDSSTTDVTILGLNSTLLSGITSAGTALITIVSAKSVYIDNINFNFNASTTGQYGIKLGNFATNKYIGVARITNCDFYNFGTETSTGIFAENTPFVTGLTANFNLPSLIIESCNFYNQGSVNIASFNYNSNIYYGRGIYLGEVCDYARVINCNFNNIRIGLFSYGGANLDVTGCNFLACFPKITGAYTFGAIYLSSGASNNGKINVVACKFNHNYGYSIYMTYSVAERPITISGCHFISNCTTAVYLSYSSAVSSQSIIQNNYFERCSQAFTLSLTNQPFGATLQPFIYLNNQTNVTVVSNKFLNDASYAIQSANSSDYTTARLNLISNTTGSYSLVGSNNVLETGTDKLVYSNAPTLVNPIVGTQTAGDNSTKAASTAYTDNALSLAPLKTNNLSDLANTTTARNNILPSKTGNASKFLRVNAGETDYELATISGGGDLLASNNLSDVANTTTALNNILPSQTGNNGKVLQTDGTNTSWTTVSGSGLTQMQIEGLMI